LSFNLSLIVPFAGELIVPPVTNVSPVSVPNPETSISVSNPLFIPNVSVPLESVAPVINGNSTGLELNVPYPSNAISQSLL